MAGAIPEVSVTPDVAERPVGTPYDDTHSTPDTFGRGIGQDVQEGSKVFGDLAATARKHANEDAVNNLRGQADSAVGQQIISDTTGFRHLHGHDAMAGSDKAMGDLKKSLDDIGAQATNQDQKESYAAYARGAQKEAFAHVQSHLAHEADVVSADSYKFAQKALIGKLGAMPVAMNEAERASQMFRLEQNATDRAKRLFGENARPEEIANFVDTARSAGVEQTLETLKANSGTPGALEEARKILKDPETSRLLGGSRMAAVEGEIYRRTDQRDGLETAQGAANASRVRNGGSPILDQKAFDDVLRLEGRPEMKKVAEQELHRLAAAGREQQKQLNNSAYVALQDAIINDKPEPPVSMDILRNPNNDSGGLLTQLESLRYQHAQRIAKGERVEDRENSRQNWNSASDYLHSDDARDEILKMSRDQFAASIDNDKLYPGGWTVPDRQKVLNEFDKVQKEGSKLGEPVGNTVKDVIGDAFFDDPMGHKQFKEKYFGPLLDKANAYVKQHKGEVDTEKLRAYVTSELITGKIKGSSGAFWPDDSARRIEAQMNPEYKGKTFAAEGQPDEVLGQAPPPRATAKQAAAPGPAVKAASLAPAAPPAAAPKPSRTSGGVTKYWNGTTWELTP